MAFISRRELLGDAALTAAGAATVYGAYKTHQDRVRQAKKEKPPKKEGVNVAFIGTGSRGCSLLRAMMKVFAANQCGRVTAVCDVREVAQEAAQAIVKTATKDTGEPNGYFDYRELIETELARDPADRLEAVVIATPHYLHGPMALDAVDAGLHVYCEKALAFSLGECFDLKRAVDAKPEIVFQVGHQRRYSTVYQKTMKMILEEDLIGDVTHMIAQWHRNADDRRPCADPALEKLINWRLYSEYSAGLMAEFGSHQIDIACWLAGEQPPLDVVCLGGIDYYRDGRDVADNANAVMTFPSPNPKVKNIRFSYTTLLTNSKLNFSEKIIGSKGMVEITLAKATHYQEPKDIDPEQLAREAQDAKSALISGRSLGAMGGGSDGEVIAKSSQVKGFHSLNETFRALEDFLELIRRRREDPADRKRPGANIDVGVNAAVPALLSNIAMEQNRYVRWDEFSIA